MVQDRAIIYSGRPIVYGLAVDLRHFQWPWTTSNPDVKVTILFQRQSQPPSTKRMRSAHQHLDSWL